MVLDTLMCMEPKDREEAPWKRDGIHWNQLKGQLEQHQSKLEGEVIGNHSGWRAP